MFEEDADCAKLIIFQVSVLILFCWTACFQRAACQEKHVWYLTVTGVAGLYHCQGPRIILLTICLQFINPNLSQSRGHYNTEWCLSCTLLIKLLFIPF